MADRSATAPNTNVSRSVSFSIIERDGKEAAIRADPSHPIEIIIPRDPNLLSLPRFLQNASALSTLPHARTFNLHFVNLSTIAWSFSIHLQLQPLNSSLSYLLIYAFDRSPQLTSSNHDIDGWSLFCSLSVRTHFLDNEQTTGHRSIIFGVRQLNTTEVDQWCINQSIHSEPPRSDQPFRFTDNYELRLYTSGCFYLETNHRWRSDGLLVMYPYLGLNNLNRSLVGGSTDESVANTVLIDSSDHIRWWFSCTTKAHRVELRLLPCEYQ